MNTLTHKIRAKFSAAILMFSWLIPAGHADATRETRPNILIILADDLGYADTGFTGSKVVQTPNLDRLAANGVVLKNGYVTHPYCGPSRSGLVTGRYQARFGNETNFTYSPYDLHQGLPLTEKTFAERLKPVGYRTGIIGKWHLGASFPFRPKQRGFDHFYGFLSGGHSYWPNSVTTHLDLYSPNGTINYSVNEGGLLPLSRNDQVGEFEEYLSTALSRDAAAFVKEDRGPFLLYLAYNAPHSPLEAPNELIQKYRHVEPWTRRVYLAMIDSMDQGIGMVLEALKQSGKLDNTLIFFLSDNGGVAPKAGYANENWADNGPLSKGKGSLFEGGCRVPYLMHWPDGLPRGVVYDFPVSSLDIAATTVALGEGDNSGHSLDGVNLIPFLNGTRNDAPHAALFWRIRDGAGWAIRTPTAKMLKEGYSSQPPELYAMQSDPYESNNIIDSRPELRQQLAQLWNAWNSKNQSNRFLQSNEYQKKRLELYRQLDEQLKADALQRPQLVIE